MVGDGKDNPALDYAKTISLDEDERVDLEKMVATPPAPKENKPGSYETFMRGFKLAPQR